MDSSYNKGEYVQLSEQLLNKNGELFLKLSGYSMFPFLKEGDIGRIVKCNISSLKIGDVIVFKKNETTIIAHRLINVAFKNKKCILTAKGDTSKHPDEPIEEKLYLGKIISYTRNKGKEVRINSYLIRLYSLLITKTYLVNTPLFILYKKSYMFYKNRIIKFTLANKTNNY